MMVPVYRTTGFEFVVSESVTELKFPTMKMPKDRKKLTIGVVKVEKKMVRAARSSIWKKVIVDLNQTPMLTIDVTNANGFWFIIAKNQKNFGSS